MRSLIAVAALVSVVACVSEHEALRNDKGQVVNCSNEGWGWIGAPVAMSNQSDCIKKAEAAGFHRQEIADTAAPQRAATPAPPVTSSPSSSAPVTPPAPVATVASPAANPPATPVNTTPPSNGGATGSTADRLRKLDDLYKAGLVTKDEYDRKRQEILSTL